MRYIDTGARQPEQALGTWLQEHIFADSTVRALRWQTGFFGAEALGYFGPAMKRVGIAEGTANFLVGSNDGMTTRGDVESLLSAAGQPRPDLRIGVLSFSNAYFHPKTIHVERADGTSAAYVGSANLTRAGVTSLHVEAGILLDSRDGDDPAILSEIAGAVDWWFAAPRAGLRAVAQKADLDPLVSDGVISAVRPSNPHGDGAGGPVVGAKLASLLKIPQPAIPLTYSEQIPAAIWAKKLTHSDAQRKASGKQRGSIALVRAGHPINAQTYFRSVLFKGARWKNEKTRTGELRQVANIRFNTTFLGQSLGVLPLIVSYAPNRESSQANYTSLLHLGYLSDYFRSYDLTNKWLRINRGLSGEYCLSIGA